jgi:hypothetical protein
LTERMSCSEPLLVNGTRKSEANRSTSSR